MYAEENIICIIVFVCYVLKICCHVLILHFIHIEVNVYIFIDQHIIAWAYMDQLLSHIQESYENQNGQTLSIEQLNKHK